MVRKSAHFEVLKLLSFLLFVAFFYAAVTLILSSDMNVAVSNIHEVKLQTTVLLLFILLWGILLFWLIGKISNVYAQKKYFGLNILIHLFLTLLVAFLMYSLWGFFAVKILLIFSLLLLFFDFVLSFFSEFSFILLSILSLGLILMVVYMCYIYGEEKNELHYRAIVDEVVNDNCVWRDKVSESVLAEKDYYIRTDDRLQKLVKTETERDSVIEQYIRNAYLRFFDEKYEVHIQICDSAQMLSIMGHDFNNRFYYSFNEVEDKFKIMLFPFGQKALCWVAAEETHTDLLYGRFEDFDKEELDEMLVTACDIIENPDTYAEACKRIAVLIGCAIVDLAGSHTVTEHFCHIAQRHFDRFASRFRLWLATVMPPSVTALS